MLNKILSLLVLSLISFTVIAVPIDKIDTLTTNSPSKAKVDLLKGIKFLNTDSIKLPVGTTGQRDGTPEDGMFRINSTTGKAEVYYSSVWGALGGGVDLWVTVTAYSVGDVKIESNKIYRCLTAHTSGTFATDLAALKWAEISGQGDLSGDVSSSGLVTSIGAGKIINTMVNASAAIAYSKLNLAGSIVNADVNSSAAIAYSKLSLAGSILNADINSSAAIDYLKLNLSSSIVNADINSSAAIAYSKLNLASSIVNADIASGAAIAYSKFASLSTGQVVCGNAGVASACSLSGGATVGATGVVTLGNSSVITQLLTGYSAASGTVSSSDTILGALQKIDGNDALKVPKSLVTTKGDLIIATASSVPARHGVGADGTIIVADSGQTNGWRNATPFISSKSEQDSAVSTTQITAPNYQLTQTATGVQRLETNSNNLLVNPSFEASTYSTGWGCTLGSSSDETSIVQDGGHSNHFNPGGAGMRCYQSTTQNAANLKGLKGVARAYVNTTDTVMQVCALVDGTTSGQDTGCVTVPATSGSSPFQLVEIPFTMGGTSNGIVIKTATATSQPTYVDNAFLGSSTAGNLTGAVTSVGSATSLGSFTSAQLSGALTNETGTDNAVFSTAPTIASPVISGHATIEGVTPTGATGTGKLVLDTAPTISAPVISGHATIEGVTPTGATGTNKLVFDTSPILVIPNIGVANGTSLVLGGTIDANAILDVQSTTLASKPLPRQTTTQKTAVGTPTEGMMSFDTTIHAPSYYDGSNWQTGLGTISVDTDWASYTPIYTGFGTVSTSNLKWRRVGTDVQIEGTFVIGTPTSTEQRISLPNSIVSASTITTLEIAGDMASNINLGGVFKLMVLKEPSVSYVTFGSQSSGVAGLLKTASSGPYPASGGIMTLKASIPISGWSSNASTFSMANANYDWRSCGLTTSDFTNFGTVTGINVWCSRVGGELLMRGTFIGGTASSAEARINLSVGGTLTSSANISTLEPAQGSYVRGGTTSTDHGGLMLMEASKAYITFSKTATFSGSAVDGYAKANADQVVAASGHSVSFFAKVPITGWSNVTSVMGPISSLSDVATISYTVSSGTNGGSATAGAWNDRPLNTIDSDLNAIVTSLSSNTITLPAGTYEVSANAETNNTNITRLRLRNTADSTTPCQGVNASDEVVNASTPSITSCIFATTASKTFKLQEWITTNSGATALGRAVSTGESEVYAQVKIRKLK